MNIYKLWFNFWQGYDTYQGAVVIAKNEHQAMRMYPLSDTEAGNAQYKFQQNSEPAWDRCELIGPAPEGSVQRMILADFHAG